MHSVYVCVCARVCLEGREADIVAFSVLILMKHFNALTIALVQFNYFSKSTLSLAAQALDWVIKGGP